jgi:hypothetical protein
MYAFNSFTRHELLRVHVLHVEWWPLALLALDRFAGREAPGRFRAALLFALALMLQGLSGGYYLVCTALVTPLWLAVAYLDVRRLPSRGELANLAAAVLLVSLPSAVILWPYARQLRAYGFEKPLVEGTDALCYVTAPVDDSVWGRLTGFSACLGVPHFLGYGTVALMGAGIAIALSRRAQGAVRRLGLLALVTAIVGLVLSLGPIARVGGVTIGPGPFALLHAALPLVRGMDGSKRIGVLVIVGGAVLGGLAVARILERIAPTWRAPVVAALAVLLPLEHWTAPRPAASVPTASRVPAVYRWLGSAGADPLVELPLYPEVSKRYWSVYLYFSTYHWRKVPIGRTSFYPPAHDMLAWSLDGFPDEVSLTLLARMGIRRVVVHPLVWEDAVRSERLAALEASKRLVLVRAFDDVPAPRFADLGLGRERVYDIVPGPPRAAPCVPEGELPRQGWRIESLRGPRLHYAGEPAHPFEDWVRRRELRTPWMAEWARDGDPRTAWITEDGQRPGDGLEVQLDSPQRVAAVSLDLGYPFDEFPRDPVLVAGASEGERRRLPHRDGPEERWGTIESLLRRPREARLLLRLDQPQDVGSLRVRLGGAEPDGVWPRWSVPELRLYRDCR